METSSIVAHLEGDVKHHSRLTFAMQEEVSEALKPGPPQQVLVEAFSIAVQKRGGPRVYAFSTHFFTKLYRCGYEGVKRWTRGVDLFAYEILLVPVNFADASHWCLAVVDFRTHEMVIYDSLGPRGGHAESIDALAHYLQEESHLRGRDLDWGGWRFYPRTVPLQKNASDCGVFICR
ncbi:sentrin-specific protease 1-like, partial [Amblyomma americanum]